MNHRPGPTAATSWTVTEDRVSLVREAVPSRRLAMAALPAPLEIDLARTALVVVDMQNDFCHPQGWFGAKGIDLGPVRKPVPVIARLVDSLRGAGARIVWLNWGIRADRANLPPSVLWRGKREPGMAGYGDAGQHGPILVEGGWGAALIDDFKAAPDDIVVHKQRLSGFWDSPLDSILRQAGITTLLFAGINTDRCVFSTLQDAGFAGYDCVLVEDACGTPSPAYVSEAIVFLVRQLHGFTTTSDALIDSLSPPPKDSP